MKSNSIKKEHKKCSNKKDKIHDKKGELYICIESNAPIDTPERNKSNARGNSKKEETFLEVNRTNSDKSVKNDIDMDKKVPNSNKIKEKYYNMLGKKRNKTNLTPRYQKQKPKENLNKYSQKSQGSNKTQENFFQIINLFPHFYDISVKVRVTYLPLLYKS